MKCNQFDQIELFSWEILDSREYVSRVIVETIMPGSIRPSCFVFGFPSLTFDFLQLCRCLSQSMLLLSKCSENIKNN